MKKINEKMLEVFLGNVNNPSNGEWIALPMEESKLREKLQILKNKYGSLIISDCAKHVDFLNYINISEYTNIIKINNIIQQPTEFIALFIDGCDDIEYATEMWRRGEYIFIPKVENLEELGEEIAKLGLVKGINQAAIDSGFVDFEKIGIEFECNGLTLYRGLGAVGQISQRDYQNWKCKPINVQGKKLDLFMTENGINKEILLNYKSDVYTESNKLIDNIIAKYKEAHAIYV